MMEDHSALSTNTTTTSGLPMSRYSTPSAPASELGHLALGSGSSGSSGKRMAPTTRSMSRRQTLASPAASSRATPNPSRSTQARPGAHSQQPSRQASRQPESDDDESSSDDDDEDSDDESEDGEAGNGGDNGGGAEALARQRMLRVFDIYAMSEPNNLIGAELMAANGNAEDNTRMHQRLAALAAHQAQANPAYLNALLQPVPIPGPVWSQIMCSNLTKRLRSIFEDLQRGLRSPAYGPDVISTAEALRALVNAIDRITTNGYWAGMNDESQRRFAVLLLTILEQVVAADRDAYEDTTVPRPSYAGQTAEHTNLYQRLVGNSPTGGFGVALLRRLDTDGRLLAGSSHRLVELHRRVVTKYAYIGNDGRLTARGSSPTPDAFIQALEQLKNNAQTQAG